MPLAVFVMMDGLRPEPLLEQRYENLFALRERSAWTLNASSLMPTITMPCHMSIFHSVPPSRHGITTNTWTGMKAPIPGLVDVARAAGKRCGFFYNWEKLRNLSQPGSLDFSYFKDNVETDQNGESILVDEALKYAANEHPDFMFVYFGTTDTTGEAFGWMTDQYFEQIERVDGTLGRLLDGLPPDTTFLLQADHGGHDKTHGTDIPEDTTIPWMVAGPGIRKGYEIQSKVTLLETAPTLARVLQIGPHPDWEGHCVDEIFE
jgi:predicted AlkP superfamily pyrophosphatase or phosphodiesterase